MINNKEKLVSIATARIAKEKGLDFILDLGGNCNCYILDDEEIRATSYHVHFYYPDREKYIFAPTQSQLQAWLRDNFDIHIVITPYTCDENDEKITPVYEYGLISERIVEEDEDDEVFDSYEEALEAALLDALTLL